MLSESNLFKYATSEMSQDAFICWLMSHALVGNKNADPILAKCAKEFLSKMVGKEVSGIISIDKQYKNVDVLLKTEEFSIIIEDKTETDTHDDQIRNYKRNLIEEGIPEEQIKCVYYKIVEQPHKEPYVDCQFDRKAILEILRKYKDCKNQIFQDYLEWLEQIEEESCAFANMSIVNWDANQWRGFFTFLVSDCVVHVDAENNKEWGWEYVNNPKNGFWGFWWNVIDGQKLIDMGIPKDVANGMYLQIEGDSIALKISASDNIQYDLNRIYELRWEIYNRCCSILSKYSVEFVRSEFRYGQSMTIGRIDYDEINYKERIKIMENMLQKISEESFL